MTPDDFNRLCSLLWGERWTLSVVADELGCSRTAVHYWKTGRRKIPAWAVKRLDEIRRARRSSLAVPVVG